jgi:hypothetical protein
MGSNVIVQGTARNLIGPVAGEIVEDAAAGETVGAYD